MKGTVKLSTTDAGCRVSIHKPEKLLVNLISLKGNPDEVAIAAIFFASDLSSYVTGVFLAVDGGFLSA